MSKLRSPKNKFRIEFKYAQPISGIGSACSITSNNVQKSSNLIEHYTDMAKRNNTSVTVTILENKKQFPEFDWQQINQYEVK